MLRCHFCDAELTDSLLQSGRCPNCGGLLAWRDAAELVAPAAPTDASGAPRGTRGIGPAASDVMDREPALVVPPVAARGTTGAEMDTERAAPQDARIADTAAEPAAGRGAAARVAPELVARVTSVWAGTIAADAQPQQTIKAASGALAGMPLVIKTRDVGGLDRPVGPRCDYELLDVIGEGGVGVVFAARQRSIDRVVAVKMLKPGRDDTFDHESKFLSEAVVTGELEHPNIVPIYDLGNNEDGALFYSMKRVRGTPWYEVIRDKSPAGNLEILMKVCDAIAFAHSRGVIHRDLKPENVMLGGFGEVLVTDWGIALSVAADSPAERVRPAACMGGTPAYMAPEMATGPLEVVGPRSDVYLLGGLLYEIVTGRPPHSGASVMDCLYAAAANVLQPTERTGELVDIARRALATDPAGRYASVQEFQAAIREHQSHTESIALAERAEEDLAEATRTASYERFSRAVFGFEEARALWPGNRRAVRGGTAARLAYAEAARSKADYELGLSLLDEKDAGHAPLVRRLRAAQREQASHRQRIAMLKRVALGLLAVLVVSGSLAFLEIVARKNDAEQAKIAAERAKSDLEDSLGRQQQLVTDLTNAGDALRTERDSTRTALESEARARAQADGARRAEAYEAYVAQIGLAAEHIEGNAFQQAQGILAAYGDSPLRNWEWGRLWGLCAPLSQMIEAGGPVDRVQFLVDGRQFLVSTAGRAGLWSAADLRPVEALPVAGGFTAIGVSDDGRYVAAADDTSAIRLYDRHGAGGLAEPLATLAGHQQGVTHLVFSSAGDRLLSTSLDGSARWWDVPSGAQHQVFLGHTWWVWQGAVSAGPDGARVATAGQDGRVLVWDAESGAKLAEFTEHDGPVYAVAFSPDGQRVASGGADRRVLIWRPDDAPPIDLREVLRAGRRTSGAYRELAGHTAAVRAVDFAPADGARVVSGGDDNSVILWDSTRGGAIRTFRGHSGRVRSCAFAPHGRAILSGSDDGRVMLWDVTGYEEVRVLQAGILRGHQDAILSARFSSDGTRVVTTSRDRTARIWDTETGEPRGTLQEGHEFLATTVWAFPDGERLLTSAGDNSTRIWDLRSSAQVQLLTGTGQHAAAAVSADGRLVLTGRDRAGAPGPATVDGGAWQAQLWKIDERDAAVVRVLEGHAAPVSAVAIARDGAWFYTGDAEGQGRLWRASSGESIPLLGHTRMVTAAVFLGGAQRLLTASGDHTIAQWDLNRGAEIKDRRLVHEGWVTSLALSPDDRWALSAAEDGLVRLWDVATARELFRIDVSGEMVQGLDFSEQTGELATLGDDGRIQVWDAGGALVRDNLHAGHGWCYALAYAPQVGKLAVADPEGSIRILDATTGQALLRAGGRGERTLALAWSPDGATVATAGASGTVSLYDAGSGELQRQFHGHRGAVRSVTWAPDGHTLASAGTDGSVRIWGSGDGAVRHILTGHDGPVRSVVFAPDGNTLASAGDDGSVRLWDPHEGRPRMELRGHEGSVRSVAFSPRGDRLASGGQDRTVRIWDQNSGKSSAVLTGHTGAVRSVDFSPDGARLASRGADATVRLWDTATGAQAALLETSKSSPVRPIAALSPDGRRALVVNANERRAWVFVMDGTSVPPLVAASEFFVDAGPVWSGTFSHDGRHIITVGGSAAHVWETDTGRHVQDASPHGVVSAACFSPDGTRVVTGSWDLTARIWDVESRRVVHKLSGGHSGLITSVTWSPDGRRVYTAGADGRICIWDAESGRRETRFGEGRAAVLGLALSRDGTRLAIAGADGSVELWDANGGQRVGGFANGPEPVVACALSPQADRIVTGTAGGAAIWEFTAEGPRRRHELEGHTAAVVAVDFSPDGRRVVTGSQDASAKVWDAETGKALLSLSGHADEVTAVGFAADGRWLLTASRDGTAILWPSAHISPSLQTTREIVDYRFGGGPLLIDPQARANAPTTPHAAALSFAATIEDALDGAERLSLLIEPDAELQAFEQERGTAEVRAGAQTLARLSGLDTALVDVALTEHAELSTLDWIIRRLAYTRDGEVREPAVRTVSFRLRSAPDGQTSQASIAVRIMPRSAEVVTAERALSRTD